MGKCISVVGIRVDQRAEHAPDLQEVITKYGSSIIARSGVPSPDKQTGIITLTCETEPSELQKMVADLKGVPGVAADSVVLDHTSR